MTKSVLAAVAGAAVTAGLVLGLVVSGFTPGAEAAPPNKDGGTTGRLIELGTHSVADGYLNFTDLPAVDTRDCSQLTAFAELADPGPAQIVIIEVLLSPDGVQFSTAFASGQGNPGAGGAIASHSWSDSTMPYAIPRLRQESDEALARDVTAWLWCEPF